MAKTDVSKIRGYKYNWIKVKGDYLKSKYNTMEEFAKEQGIPLATITKYATAWKEERNKLRQEALDLARKQVVQRNAEKIGAAIESQLNIAERLKALGIEALNEVDEKTGKKKMKPETMKETLDTLDTSIDIERKALQLDEKNHEININTQVNLITQEEIEAFKKNVKELKDFGVL